MLRWEKYITGLLTIAADQVDLPLVPQVTIKAIWEKAERLLQQEGSIVCAPGSKSFMVASQGYVWWAIPNVER